jgi:hypothetical protein
MDRHSRRAHRIQAHVERQDHALRAEVIEPRAHEIDPSDRGASDHGTADACVQNLRDRVGISQASADLKHDCGLPRQLDDDVAIAAGTVACAVQVDDMQPVGAKVAILDEQSERIRAIAGLGVEIAPQQAHAMSVLQIDGGDETHSRVR